jgi:TolB-like protein/Tfp pilus assembly protein PilF
MRCAKCDAELEPKTLGGLCPVCLLDAALPDEAVEESAAFRYDLIEEIGRGGMGVVYRAVQHGSLRHVAVKMILAEQAATPGMLERFRAEGEAIASLDHPHILPIYETGEIDATPFYSMRLVSGGTLRERVADFHAQPRWAAKLMATVARAVHHAHERGILHRDLKPGNILLDGAERTPFVSDFGLAKWLGRDNRLTLATSALGTPHYIAPEQAAGASKELTPAADVYSLGAILYELLAGRPPFVADTPLETLRLAADTPPPAPRKFEATIPRDLEVICLKCLAKEPSARYCSAEALAEDLERWLEGRTILARPSTPVERAWRWTKRNPVVAALSGALFIVLLSFLIALLSYRHPGSDPISNASPTAKSIAVLPFENLSHDPDSAYFSQGVQDEILTRLSKIADLKVISRTSTQRYKSAPENLPEIAKQLGVANVLEGSVQKNGDAVRVNVQLIKAASDSHLWADTFDRKLTDIFSVESEVAKAIADQLQVQLTGQEEQVIAAKPTDNPEAYDVYLRGLAYTLKTGNTQANSLGAQRYLREAVRLDPKFARAWALLSDVDSRGYVTQALQPTLALREEARQAAETALTLQPNLGEALLAKGYYYYACLKDYDAAVRYFEQARQFLPNSSRIAQSLAYVARRRGQWDRSESYFKEAERLDPRNVNLLSSHAGSYIMLRRFPEALGKLEQVLNITPDDVDTIVLKAGIAQAQGDLPRASALLAPLRPAANLHHALQTQVYQAILERRPAEIISRLKEILAQPDPALGFYNGELRFYLGWAQEVAGDAAAAQESWQQARNELEPFLKEQPENYHLLGDLALTNMGLGDKAAALSVAERAMAVIPIEKDPMDGPWPMEIFARVAGRLGEPDRAVTVLQKLLSIPYEGPLATTVVPLTPALLRLDPMFDPLRGDPRFDKILADLGPNSEAVPAPEKSIAVLPFENLSDQQNASFASGVQDEILTHLAKIAELKVISRTSVMSYRSGVQRNVREIGQQLGVTHLLEGSVQRSGNRVRVNAQLIDARSDSHLWAQTYDRDLADVFAVQTEIARAISDQLQVKLSPAEKAAIEQPPTADLAAFDLYNRAKALLTQLDSSDVGKNNVLQAVALLEQAVERDPRFVEGYCQLAWAHDFLYGYFDFDHTPARLALADAAVKAAQRLAPDKGEVHLALATQLLQGDGDFERARTELAAAQKTLPNAPDSFRLAASIDRRQGRWEECIRNLQRVVELDPRNPVAIQQLAQGYQQMRRYSEADAALDRALALAPKNATLRVTKAALALIWRADTHPLHSTIDSVLADDPGAAPVHADSWLYVALCERDLVSARRAIVALSGGPIRVGTVELNHNFLEGLLARVSGDYAAAGAAFTAARIEQEKVVRARPDYGPAVCALGLIDAGLGRKEDALREGRRAVELVPLSKDAPNGALMIQFFAIICGWVGERDLAFEQLAKAAALPGPIHNGVDYGRLRLHPFFDPLRSDPRFDRIVATLGPFSQP